MFTDKNYAKVIITFFIIISVILFSAGHLYCAETLSDSIKNKLDTIYQKYSNSIIPIDGAMATAIDKNYAIIPSTVSENTKKISVVALDSKLGIAVIKLNRDLTPINFDLPSLKDDLFFLLTILEEPVVILVKGKFEDSKIQIQGKQIPGSLLLSFDLIPLGVVIKSSNVSEVLLIKPFYQEIYKLINRKPGWLGLQGQTVTAELGKALSVSEGVVITNIYEGGPSDKAGLKRGDVIVQADGFKIKELKDLQNLISTKFAGESVNLTISREGSQMEVSVTLGESPDNVAQTKASYIIPQIKGTDIVEIPENVRAKLKKSIKGVFVKKIDENSPALGILKVDDIIVEINKKSITNLKDFNEAISKAGQNDLLILVYRQDSFQYVIIPGQKSH
ncbi:MAG TPA: PDZ domain-containing protein [Thermodesulfovibrio thiophilus]|nr:PDZ domain-containing protein [Thermodesulfovibrio thiophilus]